MQQIRCPKCGEVFAVDETGYNQIARQVRDAEFSKELARREGELLEKKEREIALMRLEEEKEYAEGLSKKNAELSQKDRQIAELRALDFVCALMKEGKVPTEILLTHKWSFDEVPEAYAEMRTGAVIKGLVTIP